MNKILLTILIIIAVTILFLSMGGLSSFNLGPEEILTKLFN